MNHQQSFLVGHYSALIILLALSVGIIGGVVASANERELFNQAAERYQNSSLPSREDLVDQLPALPTVFPLNPEVAKQQGATRLQALNPNQAINPDTVTQQLNQINAESANPSRLTNNIPAQAQSLGSRVTTTQSSGSSGQTAGRDVNSPSDPLGQDPQASARRQSSVTRDGTLPNGARDVTAGDPVSLASLLDVSATQDVENSYISFLASTLAIKLQIINRKTEHLAGKLDEVNTKHETLNRKLIQLNGITNDVLIQLSTLPRQ